MALKELDDAKFDECIEALKDVVDPELDVNIVDLGLIYDLAWDEDENALVISMTLTSAGCPLTDVIEAEIAENLDGVVDAFRINWVWMPPWGPERITEDGREMMRALGFLSPSDFVRKLRITHHFDHQSGALFATFVLGHAIG